MPDMQWNGKMNLPSISLYKSRNGPVEKERFSRINKESKEGVFPHLKPSEGTTRKAIWRSKVIQHRKGWGEVNISEPENASTKIAENPNARCQYVKQTIILSSSGTTTELEMAAKNMRLELTGYREKLFL